MSYFRATVSKVESNQNIFHTLTYQTLCSSQSRLCFLLNCYPPSVESVGGMHAVITHPFALERQMREQYHAQPRTHCFCAHAREKQGCVLNHLQRKTVEQVNEQGMECKGATAERKEGSIKRQWGQVKNLK